jgi:inhibitor of cysteine peptidase
MTRSGSILVMALLLSLVFVAGCGGSDSPAGTDTDSSTDTGSSTDTTAEESTAPDSLRLSQEDDGGSFEIQVGGTIELSLEANPTTGYAWEMDDADPETSLIEQIGEPTFVSDNPDAMGAGGVLTFTFRAVDRGEMVIKLVCLSPGAADAPTETFQIDLTVR